MDGWAGISAKPGREGEQSRRGKNAREAGAGRVGSGLSKTEALSGRKAEAMLAGWACQLRAFRDPLDALQKQAQVRGSRSFPRTRGR